MDEIDLESDYDEVVLEEEEDVENDEEENVENVEDVEVGARVKEQDVEVKEVNLVPYQLVRPVYTVSASKPVQISPLVSYRKKYRPYRRNPTGKWIPDRNTKYLPFFFFWVILAVF